MKKFKPNQINIEKFKAFEHSLTTVEESIKDLIRINEKYIQYTKSELDGEIIKCKMHPFVEAVHIAYSQHLPLVLTPDMIWYLIASATAIHINVNSEEMRKKFVDHEEKKRITIIRDDFVFKSKSNPWHEVIDDFSLKIKELTKTDIADLIVADFSTTTKDSRIVSQIVLMDAMKNYFEYYCSTRCAIPEFRIEGEKKDWENLRCKTLKIIDIIPKFRKWYENGLGEILQKFIDVFDDKIDESFWNEIYKKKRESGGPYITGWIIALFPYLAKEKKNRYVWETSWRECKDHFSGINTVSFSYHLNQVPFTWNYIGNEVDMLFVGGLIGVILHNDQALQPVFGYAITEDKVDISKNDSDSD